MERRERHRLRARRDQLAEQPFRGDRHRQFQRVPLTAERRGTGAGVRRLRQGGVGQAGNHQFPAARLRVENLGEGAASNQPAGSEYGDTAAQRLGIGPAIELPNLDYAQPQSLDAIDIIATNVAAAKYIVGEFASPQQRDPNATDVRLVCNDKEMFTGKGTDSLGDQWRAALFLVNKMVEQGWQLERGQILLTGSLGRMLPGTTGHCVASYHSGQTQWASLEINVTD